MKKTLTISFIVIGAIIISLTIYSNNFYQNKKNHSPQIIATIAPIHALVSMITEGTREKTSLLIPPASSPHHFRARPSDIQKIKNAQVIFRVDPILESKINKALGAQKEQKKIITLTNTPGIDLLTTRDLRLNPTSKHIKNEEDVHNHELHEEHAHSREFYDAHIWLSLSNAKHMLKFIAQKLSKKFPHNQNTYQANLKKSLTQINRLDAKIRQQLQTVQQLPFMTYHDAYQYFEKQYNLNNQGALTFEGIQPSAKHLKWTKQIIDQQSIRCIFSEPFFDQKIFRVIKTPKTAILDPLGASLKPGKSLYIKLLLNISQSLVACLSS